MLAGPFFKEFCGMLSSSTKVTFCTATYNEEFLILMIVTSFILIKTIAKFMISINAIPAFHADYPASCLTRN